MGEIGEIGRQLVADLLSAFDAASEYQSQAFVDRILAAPRLFVDGKGRSGLQARAFAMRLMHLGLPVHVVDDVTTPAIAAGDLLIIASGSGRTAALIQHAIAARQCGASMALISAARQSPLADLATDCVIIPAPTPKAADATVGSSTLQPMGSLFEQTLGLLFDTMVIVLMRRTALSSEQMFERHANLE